MARGFFSAVLRVLLWRLLKVALAFGVAYTLLYGISAVVDNLGLWAGDTRFNFGGRFEHYALLLAGIYAFFVFSGKL
jgi:hypothetical protein